MKALKLVAPSRSPERQALADAIADAAEIQQLAATARAAVERARGRMVAAQSVLSLAEGHLADARERAIGAATAEDGVQPEGLKEARRAVMEATDDLDIATTATKRAEDAATAMEEAERIAVDKIAAAAKAVLAEGFDETYAAAKALAERMARLAWIAEAMGFACDDNDGTSHRRYSKAQTLNPQMVVWNDDAQRVRDGAKAEVAAARAALLSNPDAPLPEVA